MSSAIRGNAARAVFGLALAAISLSATGCVDGGSRFTSRDVEGASPDAVLRAGEMILRRDFGRVTVDHVNRRIDTTPVEAIVGSDTALISDAYGGPTRTRKTAHFEVSARGETAVASLRVDVEREDTDRRAYIQPDRYSRLGADWQSDTAVQRDAATTNEQNRLWTYVRRDLRLERALLEELQDTFGPPPARTEATEWRPPEDPRATAGPDREPGAATPDTSGDAYPADPNNP
ncbi:MAG: hypothetical protein KDA32_03765 [Phycisphaerales bacterium]|nr:hypothetical protein [Phycisphaerales bacterium]